MKYQLNEMVASEQFHQIITANALLLLEAEKSAALRDACRAASLVLPESAGAIWALRRSGAPSPHRISGVDLALQMCEVAARIGKPVFLLGGKPGIAEQAANFLKSRIPGIEIAGALDGFYDPARESTVIGAIRVSHPALVLVAMGMPRQDIWIHQHRNELPPAVYIGVGGTFDVWAGRVRRAPVWFQKRGLEWLFRLVQEPHRWNRIAKLPVFALRILFSR